jgi:hypothetical protein
MDGDLAVQLPGSSKKQQVRLKLFHRELNMRILIILILLISMFLAGCNSMETTRIAQPVPSYIQGDENKDCGTLKEELTQIDKNIDGRTQQADDKKSGNFLLATAGCFSVVPWFFMDMDSVEVDKIEVAALHERYTALSLLAQNKGCKSITEDTLLTCKYCGPSDSEEWMIVEQVRMCYDCYKKHHPSQK